MRICDGLIAIPGILLAIALIAALGTSSWNVVIALTIVYTPSVARTVRASAMVIKEQTYVEAAKVQGFSNFRILWKMILPGVISPLTVQASFIFAQAIISEASLSFLGAGVPAPDPYVKRKDFEALKGEQPVRTESFQGCAFASRCPYATGKCRQEAPVFREVKEGHKVACHRVE